MSCFWIRIESLIYNFWNIWAYDSGLTVTYTKNFPKPINLERTYTKFTVITTTECSVQEYHLHWRASNPKIYFIRCKEHTETASRVSKNAVK